MSIEKTSTAQSSLQAQAPVTSSSSSLSSTEKSLLFQKIMSDDTAATPTPPPTELTALQRLFRSPPATVADAVTSGTSVCSNSKPVDSTSGTETGNPSLPQEPLDPSPAAPWPTTVIRPNPTPELAGQAKSAVLGALQKNGVDPSTVKISYWEELVTYPGGNYTNRNITVQTASGRKIDLDAAYMARCPWLAASAVQELDQVVT
jgi:hypothetical protein